MSMRFRKVKAKRRRLEQAEKADDAVRGCFDVVFCTALRVVSVGFLFSFSYDDYVGTISQNVWTYSLYCYSAFNLANGFFALTPF